MRGQSTSEEERDEEHEARCERRRGRRILLRELADWLVLALHEALTEDILASARAQMAALDKAEPRTGPPPELYAAPGDGGHECGHACDGQPRSRSDGEDRGGSEIFEKSGW
ncbi:MAG: hypothetical protein R3C97_12975 [Geminicoccaceae bacterium]